ncbi:MAG: site-2 protease family protein [Betaproteobacteria bacterium]|nr:site-2 protease family protein [Betaproteobacteria bacterium]
MTEQLVAKILIWIVPVLLAITVHEAAHGYVARYFGDPTAEQAGRISLDPFRHIDPVGTVLVPLGIFLLSYKYTGEPWAFGWAKPVPVNFNRLRNPKADMLWVAAAGPFANLVMAVIWAMVFAFTAKDVSPFFASMAVAGMTINGVLLFLNLLPIPPLDGGRIAVSLLPDRLARKYARIEPFGFPILLVLIAYGKLGAILEPLLDGFLSGLMRIFGY